MDDNRLEVEIEADETPAAGALDRLKAKARQAETVLVDMGRKASGALDSLTRGMVKMAEVMGTAYMLKQTWEGMTGAVMGNMAAFRQHSKALDEVVMGYRAARIALSPTVFTVGTVALVAFTEHALRAAWAEGKLAEAQAMQSARTGMQIREIRELTLAGERSGLGANFWTDARKSLQVNARTRSLMEEMGINPDQTGASLLRDIAAGFEDIQDPAERARKAIAFFGDDAEKILPALNARLDDSIARFHRLGAVMGTETAIEFARFKSDVERVKGGLEELLGVPAGEVRKGVMAGFGAAGAAKGVVDAWNDPAAKNATALIGKWIGEAALNTMLVPFLFSPGREMTPEEREGRRRRNWEDQDYVREAQGLVKQPTVAGQLERQIAAWQERRNALAAPGRTATPEVRARMAEIDRQLASLRQQQNPLATVLGDSSRQYVDKFEKSLDGLNARLGVLKQRREQILTSLPYATSDVRAFVSGMLPGLEREIASVQTGIQGYEGGRAQRDALRASRERLAQTRTQVAGPVAGILADSERAAVQMGTYMDAQGVTHQVKLLNETRLNLERDLQLRMIEEQKKTIAAEQKAERERYELRLAYESEAYKRRLEYELSWSEKALAHAEAVYGFEEQRAGMVRDARLRAVEGADAQTVAQKIGVEQQKADIEIEYLDKVHEIKMRLFDMETSRMVAEQAAHLRALGYTADQVAAKIGEYAQQREDIRQQQGEINDAAIQAAGENARNRQLQITRDHYREVFQTLKQEAGGVIDAMFTRSTNVFAAMGNALKAAVLTAIKDVLSSRIAAALTQLVTGQRVSFAPGGSGLLGALGLASTPVFGAGGVIGGPGGTSGFAGPVAAVASAGGRFAGGMSQYDPRLYPTAGVSGGGSSGASSFGGFNLGSLQKTAGAGLGMLGFGTMMSGVQRGSSAQTIGGGAMMGAGIGLAGGPVGAVFGVGAGLFLDAMRRGGGMGVAEGAAGGAMMGWNLGGPLGALIGGGIGALAGVVRLFVKGAQEKTREKIKALYGVDVASQSVLAQIVQMAKQSFGGNLDMAIRSSQVRDLVELYAQSTGQRMPLNPNVPRPVSFVESGGQLFQAPNYYGGSPYAYESNLPMLGGGSIDRIPSGTPMPAAAPIIVYAQVPGAEVGNFLQGQTVRTVTQVRAARAGVSNPALVLS